MQKFKTFIIVALGLILVSSFVTYQTASPNSSTKELKVTNTTSDYIKKLINDNEFSEIKMQFPATSAGSYFTTKTVSGEEPDVTIEGNILKIVDTEEDEEYFFNLDNAIRFTIKTEKNNGRVLTVNMPF
ncbi:MAG TPA: hypothetical protein VEC12_06845 [Bacteroidia bacterium]|nr:hypothetical protein [Bacteroidia bacterium]